MMFRMSGAKLRIPIAQYPLLGPNFGVQNSQDQFYRETSTPIIGSVQVTIILSLQFFFNFFYVF